MPVIAKLNLLLSGRLHREPGRAAAEVDAVARRGVIESVRSVPRRELLAYRFDV